MRFLVEDLQVRIAGSLLGLACGDGLGGPFEGSGDIDAHRVLEWAAADRALSYSDDTAMACVLARHLAENRGRIVDDELVVEFARAWRTEPDRGYGAGPPEIFRVALDGGDWRSVVRQMFGGGGSLGNGGAMRVAPVALTPWPLPDRVELARQQAAVTHAHPQAIDGAALLCAAIGTALEERDPIDPSRFLRTVAGHVHMPGFRDRMQIVLAVVNQRMEPGHVGWSLGNDVTALGSVPTALALFLLNPDDPWAAITGAVQAGGDTDTIAAMTGALAGARCGADVLPASWLARLEAGPRIRRLAYQLASLHQSG